MQYKKNALVIIMAVICFLAVSEANALSYTAMRIGNAPTNESSANDINERGQIVGWSVETDYHAFLYEESNGFRDLGTLGGQHSTAWAINDAGKVTGSADTADGDLHAFIYEEGTGMVDLGTLGGLESSGEAINASGQVVGWSETESGDRHAFLYDPVTGMQDLGTLGGRVSMAQDLNDKGQVVGYAETETGEIHAFLYDPVNGMVDLGTLGGDNSDAFAINNKGQIVGSANTEVGSFLSRAFLYEPTVGMQDLGMIGGDFALSLAINESTQIVGHANTEPGNLFQSHSFLYQDATGMVDLNSLLNADSTDLTLADTFAINNKGQILAVGGKSEGERHPYLLLPVLDPGPSLAMDGGEVRINHRPARVNFSHRFEQPVVLAHSVTKKGGQPYVIRIYNIDNQGFTIKLQEYGYLDGRHVRETVNYLVMEEGSHTLPNGTHLEAGRFEVQGNGEFSVRELQQPFNTTPVIVTSVTSANGYQAVVGRVDDVTSAGFKYMLQEQEANTDGHVLETISYIAWEPGSGTIDAINYQVVQPGFGVGDTPRTLTFEEPFAETPLVLADMQSTLGANTAKLTIRSASTTGIRVFVEEEASKDRETRHVAESVGFIALSQE